PPIHPLSKKLAELLRCSSSIKNENEAKANVEEAIKKLVPYVIENSSICPKIPEKVTFYAIYNFINTFQYLDY
ncbi:16574_t:CDS:1, partial [Gigaspora margarita]